VDDKGAEEVIREGVRGDYDPVSEPLQDIACCTAEVNETAIAVLSGLSAG
jgi:hypothetical protein